jgi:hypothetical protein
MVISESSVISDPLLIRGPVRGTPVSTALRGGRQIRSESGRAARVAPRWRRRCTRQPAHQVRDSAPSAPRALDQSASKQRRPKQQSLIDDAVPMLVIRRHHHHQHHQQCRNRIDCLRRWLVCCLFIAVQFVIFVDYGVTVAHNATALRLVAAIIMADGSHVDNLQPFTSLINDQAPTTARSAACRATDATAPMEALPESQSTPTCSQSTLAI